MFHGLLPFDSCHRYILLYLQELPQYATKAPNLIRNSRSGREGQQSLQTVTRGDQLLHVIWTQGCQTSVSDMQTSCIVALAAADAVLLYIDNLESDLAVLLVLFKVSAYPSKVSAWVHHCFNC